MKRGVLVLLISIVFIIGCAQEEAEKPSEIEIQTTTTTIQETTTTTTIREKVKEKLMILETDWTTFHGNNARTGFSDSEAPSTTNVLWKWTIKDFMNINYDGNFDKNWPIVDKNKVFIAAENIFAFDLKTGEKVWNYFEEGDFYPKGLVSGNGKIFATVNDNDNPRDISLSFIYTLDEETGKFLWKYQTEKGMSHSLPLFADDKVFVGDDSGKIYAINAGNGDLAWKKSLPGAAVIHSSPAFDNGIIFVGTEDSIGPSSRPSHLYALNPDNGEIIWSFETDVVSGKLNLIHAAPAISDNVVYVGAENGYFYALNSKDGSLIWKQKIASGSGELVGVSAAAALGYGKVFIGTYEGKFLALDQKDGKVVWEYPIGKGTADFSPILADDKVYYGANDGNLYSFNQQTGKIVWKQKLNGPVAALASGILVAQDTLQGESFNENMPMIIAFSDDGRLSVN